MLGGYVFGFIGLVIQGWNGEMSMTTNLLSAFNDFSSMGTLIFVGLSNFLISLAAGLVLYEGQLSI